MNTVAELRNLRAQLEALRRELRSPVRQLLLPAPHHARVYLAAVATTGNITLSGAQTIDGHAVSVGQLVVVWRQTSSGGNGLYRVAAGTWTRVSDEDGFPDSALVAVSYGDTYAATWFLFSADGIVGMKAFAG